MFEGEILKRANATTLLQIFYAFLLNSKVIFKSIVGPDEIWQGDLQT